MSPPARRRILQGHIQQVVDRHRLFIMARSGGARAVLTDCDLTDIRFPVGATLSHASLKGAQLCAAHCACINFDGADLFGADLRRAQLIQASLVRADLRGACFFGADLTDANLAGANLSEGCIADQVDGALHVRRFGTDPADLTDARLVRANLAGAISVCQCIILKAT